MNNLLISPEMARESAPKAMHFLQLRPEPWQLDVLRSRHRRLLLNCYRSAGKSTIVALWSVLEAVSHPDTKIVLLSRSLPQSKRLFRLVAQLHHRLGAPEFGSATQHQLELINDSSVVCLPCNEDTVRGITNVKLLVIDEAAKVPDDLYYATRPMLSASEGRLVCMSTPFGKRGFFYRAWVSGDPSWHRIHVPVSQDSHVDRAYLDEQRRAMGESWYRQEYECSFTSMEGLIYPDFAKQVTAGREPEWREVWGRGTRVGGLDFGTTGAFAAVWGAVDHEGVLWITGEYYHTSATLAQHAQHLPRDVKWYADPSGEQWILELRSANFKICKGISAVDTGINAVRTRLGTGRLRVKPGCCPHLLSEAELYRWDPDAPGKPLKENDHAMDALRYLVARIDKGKSARWWRWITPKDRQPPDLPPPPERPKRKWLSIYNEALWTPICTIERTS